IFYPTRQLVLSEPTLVAFNLFVYGALLILIVLFEPRGLMGMLARLADAVSVRARPAPSAGATGSSHD
ncbi:MAG TPA: hypothetical protein VIG69_00520, partial [Candidatus Methylomirabilis sp.]